MSNHIQRIVVAVIAIPAVVLISINGGLLFFLFVALISSISLYEFYGLARAKGASPATWLGISSGLLISLSFYQRNLASWLTGLTEGSGLHIPFPSQAQLILIFILLILVVLLLTELFRNRGSALLNLATTLMGILYVSFFLGTLIGIRELFNPSDFPVGRYFPDLVDYSDPSVSSTIYRWGGYTVISLFALIWICDSAAYYAGTAIGKHKLFPRVSPNKSWEGTIAGFLFSIFCALIARHIFLGYLSAGSCLVVGAIVGIFGQLGDLVESLLKRDASLKDSSSLIPGHGGVLDRFDSLIFASPLVYFYLDFVLFS